MFRNHHRKIETPQSEKFASNGESDRIRDHQPSEEAIRLLAYQKWEQAGKPLDDGQQFWSEAEQELTNLHTT
jgi:hypothetical protein